MGGYGLFICSVAIELSWVISCPNQSFKTTGSSYFSQQC